MVTTLADLIYEPTRKLTYQVRVNGVLLVSSNQATALNELSGVPGVIGVSWDDATAQIRINRCPSWMRAGMPVTIDAGFNNLNMRVWTGAVVALPGEDPDYLRSKVIVRGATVQVGTPPDDVPSELSATATLVGADIQPPLPEGTHIEHEISVPLVNDSDRLSAIATRELTRYGVVPRRPSGQPNEQVILCGGELHKAARAYQLDEIDIAGMDSEDVIRLICDLVGITSISLTEPSDGYYSYDVDMKLRRGRPLDMLAQVMLVEGMEAYHTEDGTVIFREVEFAPGPSHAWSYDVQDQDLARIISATGELEVTFNPFVRKYSTGLLNIPFLNFNDQRVFARTVRHSLGPEGAFTYIDAWGGSRLGGTIAIDPIAAFTFVVDREVIGDAVYLVYTCNASSSFDPDGSIASYAWTCNRTTTPSSLSATQIMSFRVPSTVATPLTLTLTVTDNDGNTHATSVDLPTAATESAITIPAIFAALENTASATPDGAENWNDQSSSTCVSVDAKPADGVNSGIACYGYTDGSIKRTTDFCASALTTVKAAAGADGTINEVWWDKNVITRVWACTSTGRLYRSDNDGVTWVLHKDFGGTYPLHRIATPIPQGVWVFGGRGDDTTTLIQYEAIVGSGVWTSVAVGGHLSTDLAGAASSVHVRSAAGRMAGELAILLNGTVPGGVNYFYTANVFDPTGAGWTRGTGTLVGDTDGREVLPDFQQGTFRVMFGDRSVHSCTDNTTFTEAANVLPAGFTPNRALWLGDFLGGFSGVYLVAAEDAGHTGAIYKSTDGLASVDELRPATGYDAWPVSADARGIAIGAPQTTTGASNIIMLTEGGATNTVTKLQGATWTPTVAVSGSTQSGSRVFPINANLIFATDESTLSNDVGGGLFRSTDGGATWAATSVTNGVAVCRAADGRLWAIGRTAGPFNQTKIYRDNLDDGATWNLMATVGDGSSNSREGILIAAHPTNAKIIAVWGPQTDGAAGGFVTHTVNGTDGTPTFSTDTANAPSRRQSSAGAFFTILATGRWIIGTFTGTTTLAIVTTDDMGATAWATKYSLTGSGAHRFRGIGGNATKLVTMLYNATTGDAQPLVSTDGGNSWAVLAGIQTWEDYTGGVTPDTAAYDFLGDALYVGDDNVGVYKVVRFSPVTIAGSWSNVSFNVPDSQYMGEGSIAVIP